MRQTKSNHNVLIVGSTAQVTCAEGTFFFLWTVPIEEGGEYPDDRTPRYDQAYWKQVSVSVPLKPYTNAIQRALQGHYPERQVMTLDRLALKMIAREQRENMRRDQCSDQLPY